MRTSQRGLLRVGEHRERALSPRCLRPADTSAVAERSAERDPRGDEGTRWRASLVCVPVTEVGTGRGDDGR
jgi:hypothetical protein